MKHCSRCQRALQRLTFDFEASPTGGPHWHSCDLCEDDAWHDSGALRCTHCDFDICAKCVQGVESVEGVQGVKGVEGEEVEGGDTTETRTC